MYALFYVKYAAGSAFCKEGAMLHHPLLMILNFAGVLVWRVESRPAERDCPGLSPEEDVLATPPLVSPPETVIITLCLTCRNS